MGIMKPYSVVLAFMAMLDLCHCQQGNITFLEDSGRAGPELEIVHAYHGQWPTGEPGGVSSVSFIRIIILTAFFH